MERLPIEQKTHSKEQNSEEEVRGILQRLLRMATRVMAKKLFDRSRAKSDELDHRRRFPKL